MAEIKKSFVWDNKLSDHQDKARYKEINLTKALEFLNTQNAVDNDVKKKMMEQMQTSNLRKNTAAKALQNSQKKSAYINQKATSLNNDEIDMIYDGDDKTVRDLISSSYKQFKGIFYATDGQYAISPGNKIVRNSWGIAAGQQLDFKARVRQQINQTIAAYNKYLRQQAELSNLIKNGAQKYAENQSFALAQKVYNNAAKVGRFDSQAAYKNAASAAVQQGVKTMQSKIEKSIDQSFADVLQSKVQVPYRYRENKQYKTVGQYNAQAGGPQKLNVTIEKDVLLFG